MLFNSYEFLLLFWPAIWVIYRLASRSEKRQLPFFALVVASLLFYGWWRPSLQDPRFQYLPLILLSIGFNFVCGRTLGLSKRPRKGLLTLGVAFNLGLLAWFKYTGFLGRTVEDLFGVDLPLPDITLPIAISFFTFQQIAYLVDAHTHNARERSFLRYSLFVCFFPQLIAGPIVHHRDVIPQFRDPATRRFQRDLVTIGLMIFAIGLFKKVVMADGVEPLVRGVFEDPSLPGCLDAWGAVLAYTLQLYFDFSGYADMAIGIALTFNIRLPENFDSPYQARNIADFWRRWHMTLSRFLRDYLYIPLGGNRKGSARRHVNLMLTMLLGGLWHGANWTFVVWGGLHGLYLVIQNIWSRVGVALPTFAARAITLLAVMVGWVFFRAGSFDRAVELLGSMAGVHGGPSGSAPYSLNLGDFRTLVLSLGIVLFAPNRQAILASGWLTGRKLVLAFTVLMVTALLSLADPSPFLYFQF